MTIETNTARQRGTRWHSVRHGAVSPGIERYALRRDTARSKIKLAEPGEWREARTHHRRQAPLAVSVSTEERREGARACPFTDGHGSSVRARERERRTAYNQHSARHK